MKKKVIILIIIIVGVSLTIRSRYQHTSPKRLADHYEKTIPQFHSSADKDHDGIDDQTDILKGAIDYVNTRPHYKSVYYQGGYSNDEYGVCSDVVAHALRSAGYDLMTLVSSDIEKHENIYDIQHPDKNIDFRRVRNLRIYFKRKAIEMTTDIHQIKRWQGGDIVIFKSHIGIVSDRRNRNGVPYVIHHNDPWQRYYEQDILEKRNDLVGHYRVSQ